MVYIISFLVLFVLIHFSQEYLMDKSNIRFSLWDTNVYFAAASLLICIHFQFFSLIKNLETQLGFIYLPTLFIKGVLFYVAFKDSVFKIEVLNMTERLSLLIPLLLFLALEVFFVVKIIDKDEL
ncbi:DUF6168 family protein [Winogradskyella bathintestinalis]|uniref:DUF6168 family protein n=1 Tax=Winogradskyella bathintestinalis TaxID=3035208 RepID=A0ABT7ZSA0_9FLAO|nr:DUF6168 family protein [Winogradskyella bathintestinalis]MDN3491618.1 DUF6168 family protein [Winogradskyella bathintestinalis]